MQLIDEKGKVFGIINIIDLTILLFLTSTITGFGWLYYTGDLFRDLDPARKLYAEKDAELLLENQSRSILRVIEREIGTLNNNQTLSLRLLAITTTPHIEKKGPVEITRNETYDIILRATVPTISDLNTAIPYYNHPTKGYIPLVNGTLLTITIAHFDLNATIISMTV